MAKIKQNVDLKTETYESHGNDKVNAFNSQQLHATIECKLDTDSKVLMR